MQQRHLIIVKKFSSLHSVTKMYFPVIPVVHISQSRGGSTFSHHGMGFTQKGFADQTHGCSLHSSFNGRSKACSSSPDHSYLVDISSRFSLHRILQSVQIPRASILP